MDQHHPKDCEQGKGRSWTNSIRKQENSSLVGGVTRKTIDAGRIGTSVNVHNAAASQWGPPIDPNVNPSRVTLPFSIDGGRERRRSGVEDYCGDNKECSTEKNFLDKFRLQTSGNYFWRPRVRSRSLITSPANTSYTPPYSCSPSANSEILFGNFNVHSKSQDGQPVRPKSKKWYSFSNLLSRSSFKGLLTSRSRLSVSSIFTTNSDVTPTEPSDFGFPSCPTHQVVPASPSPSCATVSGEYPSRNGCGSVIFRRPRYAAARSSSVNAAGETNTASTSVTDQAHTKELQLEREPSYKTRQRAHRVSCGDFYPGSHVPTSPGFLGLDFQYHSYNYNKNGSANRSFDGIPQPKRTLGRSLPTLLEAMESKMDGIGAVQDASDGNHATPITVETVSELLYQEFLILTGSKTLDDHYLLIFPDRGNFHQLGDEQYKMLVKYLVSIPPMQDAEAGFVIIIDRRNDKWNSVKTTLLKISGYFPGLIHRVFVLRPLGFLQKALSEVSSKLFRNENLRFRLTVCNNVTDLLSFADSTQLTMELGGTLEYDKIQWVRERVEVESFHAALQNLSRDLKIFTESFRDMEYPNDASATEAVIRHRTSEFSILRSDLIKAGEHGEKILKRIKNGDNNSSNGSSLPVHSVLPAHPVVPVLLVSKSSVQLVNVILLERFILQIEETTRLFQEFWDKELLGLERCLLLRRFEHDFKELQTSFDLHVKSLTAIPEMGENVFETEQIILETVNYQDLTKGDLTTALQLETVGREIVSSNPTAVDIVEPKCLELSRMASHFRFILQEKLTRQKQWREVQTTMEKANELCTESIDLLNTQQMNESLDESPDFVSMKSALDELSSKLQSRLTDLTALKTGLTLSSASQAKTLVKQIVRRVEEVQELVAKRHLVVLQQLDKKQSGPFLKCRRASGTFFESNRSSKAFSEDQSDGSSMSSLTKASLSSTTSSDGSQNGKSFEDDGQEKQVKRFHVLQELLHTEQTYVEEIGLILTGYRDQVTNMDVQGIVPSQLIDSHDKSKPGKNVSVLFCNLEEIYAFHSKIFLPDLTVCVESIELVALCFIQRHSDFLAMYSDYCQLKGASDILLKEIGEGHPWLVWCQEKLGHRLSLSSYLLKPVQRITKYHLLLGNLVKYSQMCGGYHELTEAVDCMVVVVRSVNDAMHQLQIRGYPGKMSSEGPLILQGQFAVWIETAKNRLSLKCHQRYLFLHHKSILVCKKTGSQSTLCYEFKNKINLSEVGITEEPKGSGTAKKFEIWLQGRQEVFLFQAPTREVKVAWVTAVKKLLMEQLQYLREAKGSTTPTQLTPNFQSVSMSAPPKSTRFTKANTLNGHWAQPSHSTHRQSYQERPRSCSGVEADFDDDL